VDTAGGTGWGSPWAWFGTTLGATCWMLISAGVLVARHHPGVALVFGGCFLLPLATAIRAWRRRAGTGVYGALRAWFVVAWLCSVLAIAVTHVTDTHADINLPGDQIWWMWAALAATLPLVLTFRRRRGGDDGRGGALLDVLGSWL
jgi:hypothetical protein